VTSAAPPAAVAAADDELAARADTVSGLDLVRALRHDALALTAVVFLLVLAFVTLFAGIVSPYDPLEQHLARRALPPLSAAVGDAWFPHLLGTDELGRDVLSRLLHGGRVSVAVGLGGAAISGVVGVALGLLAGFYGGRVDDLIMRAVDVMMAIPTLLLALFVLFILGGGFLNLILVLALLRWMIFARLTRSLVLSLRESSFIASARAIGCRNRRIILRHLLPNMIPAIAVLFTLEVAIFILNEAALSFLGFGIQPPQSSWGLMIARGRNYLTSAWWLITFPGIAIFLTTLCLNLVANWVRTITDPMQRWRWLMPRSAT
jgi:peptide/nickel transport system permease protein